MGTLIAICLLAVAFAVLVAHLVLGHSQTVLDVLLSGLSFAYWIAPIIFLMAGVWIIAEVVHAIRDMTKNKAGG
jgi:hypothetical protein